MTNDEIRMTKHEERRILPSFGHSDFVLYNYDCGATAVALAFSLAKQKAATRRSVTAFLELHGVSTKRRF
jgi:hypothetical protein